MFEFNSGRLNYNFKKNGYFYIFVIVVVVVVVVSIVRWPTFGAWRQTRH